MMESIEKLRTVARNMAKGCNLENHEECNLFLIIADEIEAEIADLYMQSPVDADGKLWSMEDKTFVDDLGDVYQLYAIAWVPPVHQWYLLDQDKRFFLAKECHHVKERTVEDVLREMISMTDQPLCEEDIQAFADELREMLKNDEEV